MSLPSLGHTLAHVHLAGAARAYLHMARDLRWPADRAVRSDVARARRDEATIAMARARRAAAQARGHWAIAAGDLPVPERRAFAARLRAFRPDTI